jgi:RNAse (barnase) inhibitor barstar
VIPEDKLQLKDEIKDRREEASEVKQCFTDFAFKGLLLTTVFFGFIFKFYPLRSENTTGNTDNVSTCMRYLLIWILCGVIILVLMRILRIGFHKYSTANRNYGYVLHLDRTFDYENDATSLDYEDRVRGIGWEEAMCAWRVIQPILFEEVYKLRTVKERVFFPFVGIERHPTLEYRWWNTELLMNSEGDLSNHSINDRLLYHPGSYLEKTQRLIHFICIVVYFVFTLSYYFERNCMYDLVSLSIRKPLFFVLYALAWFLSLFWFIAQILRQQKLRRILERGILSIQSSAVVWRLVVVSHLKVVEGLRGYRGYTRLLAEKADLIRLNLEKIHETIMKNNWPQDRIVLDVSSVSNEESLHRYLSKIFNFPTSCGPNWNDFDEHIRCISNPSRIEVKNFDKLEIQVQEAATRLKECLNDFARQQTGNMQVEYCESDGGQ